MESRWDEVQAVLGDLLEHSAEPLESLNRRNLAPEVRRRVEELLRAFLDSEGFLDSPPLPLSPEPDRRLGQRLGPWRLEAAIGWGGMGTVYRAERDDGEFKQRVAIKVIAAGRLSRQMERRFREERQILARIEHPNVSRLIDGGMAVDGSPYLVMEYVDGTPIDVWCREQALDSRGRLRLFGKVCETVQFAHQNLIVHCDLKPANILVTGEGVPKLLDFGIARFLAQDGGEAATLLHPMTADYASPEQVRGLPPGTASDTYSLGILLHELLTGKRPYRLAGKPLDEVLATVCDREIDRPGTGAADLDAIILQALEKKPQRRYPSVERLALDVRAYLEGRPVAARPASFFYRARKFASRNAMPMAACTVIVIAIVAGGLSTLAESRRALRRFNDVRNLAHSLLFDVYDSVKVAPGTLAARRLLVSRAQQYLDSLSLDAAGDSALTRELALSYQRLGEVLGSPYTANLGDTAGAYASFRKAESLLDREAARYPADAVVQDQLFQAHLSIGRVLVRQRNADAALAVSSRAVAEAEALYARQPGDPTRVLKLSQAYGYLAEAYGVAASRDPSVKAAEQVLTTSKKSLEILDSHAPVSSDQWRASIASRCFTVGYALFELGDRTGNLSYYRQALDIRLRGDDMDRELASAHPEQPDRREFADGLANVALSRWKCCRDLAGALRDQNSALGRFQKLADAEPQNLELRRDVSNMYQNIGLILAEAGRRPEALAANRKALQILEELGRADPASGENSIYLAQVRARIAELQNHP